MPVLRTRRFRAESDRFAWSLWVVNSRRLWEVGRELPPVDPSADGDGASSAERELDAQ
jgi:hypothetical protein